MNLDPTAPLMDFIVHDGSLLLNRIEQPNLTCTCEGTGWIDNAWLHEDHKPKCTCKFQDMNFEHLHEESCDAVPCPFCLLEPS